MRTGSAEVKAANGCLVLSCTRERSDHQELVEGQITVMPVSTSAAIFALKIHR
jgi:hypothetical protein